MYNNIEHKYDHVYHTNAMIFKNMKKGIMIQEIAHKIIASIMYGTFLIS